MGNWPWALFGGGSEFTPPIFGPWALPLGGPKVPHYYLCLLILEFSHISMHGINNGVKFANCQSQKLDRIIIIIIIALSVLREVHSLHQNEFSRECDPVLPCTISSSFPPLKVIQ